MRKRSSVHPRQGSGREDRASHAQHAAGGMSSWACVPGRRTPRPPARHVVHAWTPGFRATRAMFPHGSIARVMSERDRLRFLSPTPRLAAASAADRRAYSSQMPQRPPGTKRHTLALAALAGHIADWPGVRALVRPRARGRNDPGQLKQRVDEYPYQPVLSAGVDLGRPTGGTGQSRPCVTPTTAG